MSFVEYCVVHDRVACIRMIRTLHFGDEEKENNVMAAHTGIGAFSGDPTEWEDYERTIL